MNSANLVAARSDLGLLGRQKMLGDSLKIEDSELKRARDEINQMMLANTLNIEQVRTMAELAEEFKFSKVAV